MRLYQKIIASTAMIDLNQTYLQKSEFYRALTEILGISLEPLPLPQIMEKILTQLLEIADGCSWFNVNTQKGSIGIVSKSTVQWLAQKGIPAVCQDEVPFNQCYCGKVAATGSPIISGHSLSDGEHTVRPEGMTDHGHYVLPIKIKGSTVGILNLYTAPGHQTSVLEKKFLESVTHTLVGIIARTRSEDARLVAEREKAAAIAAATMANYANDAIVGMDSEGNISFWNKRAEEMFGYSKEKAIGKNLHGLLAPKGLLPAAEKGFANFAKTGKGPVVNKTVELIGQHKDGTTFPIDLSISGILENGKWIAVGVVRDISDRKALEADKARILELLKNAAQSARFGLWDWDPIKIGPDGTYEGRLDWVHVEDSLFGLDKEKVCFLRTYSAFLQCVYPEDLEKVITAVNNALVDPHYSYQIEHRVLWPDGSVHWVEETGEVIRSEKGEPLRMVGMIQDIDERIKQATEQRKLHEDIRKALAAKDAILRDIHHTMKNNYQLVSSLLSLALKKIKTLSDPKEIEQVIKEAIAKIQFMSHVHELIYQSENYGKINSRKLVSKLADAYQNQGIQIAVEVADISLDSQLALPVGMIIQELILNAIKHAFPEEMTDSKEIKIRLTEEAGTITLVIQDNGKGLPANFIVRDLKSHGLISALGMIKDKLRGTVECGKPDKETQWIIKFPAEKKT